MKKLEGRVAIVTGASSGVGRGLAKVLAENGAKICACARRVEKLEELKAERNHVSEAWTRYGVQVNSALQSQALLQVKREYCDTHRCLHCKIGAEIFRRVGRG